MTAHELSLAIRTAYLALHRQTDSHLAPLEITADQFVVMSALSERDALTQRDLVTRTSSDPNTTRAILVLLENRGLIIRQAHPTDRRARSVALTPRGRKLLARLWTKGEPVRQRLLDALDADEADTFGRLLKRVAAALQSISIRAAVRDIANDSHEQPLGRPVTRRPSSSTNP